MPSGGDDLPPLDPATLARAEQALSALSERYLGWALADLARLEACLDEAVAQPLVRAERLTQLFGIAHDMKGQGTTFGYHLISELGQKLCRVVEVTPPDTDDLGLITVLVGAMGRVLRERMAGDGGEEGRRLLDSLKTL